MNICKRIFKFRLVIFQHNENAWQEYHYFKTYICAYATLLNYYHHLMCMMGLQGIVQMQLGVLTDGNRCYHSFVVFYLLESRAENELFYDNTYNIFAI